MSQKIFLSYAFQDRALAESLKSRMDEFLPKLDEGAVQIFDVQDLVAGDDIRQSIKAAIESASTVVIISTESSDLSPSVYYEAGLADAMGKNLVIVGHKGAGKTALLRRFLGTARVVEVENG